MEAMRLLWGQRSYRAAFRMVARQGGQLLVAILTLLDFVDCMRFRQTQRTQDRAGGPFLAKVVMARLGLATAILASPLVQEVVGVPRVSRTLEGRVAPLVHTALS